MRTCCVLILVALTGCGGSVSTPDSGASATLSLAEARQGYQTEIVTEEPGAGPAEAPPEGVLELIQYDSPVGPLAAYVTPDPGDGERRAAILWITGGDNNSIGSVWNEAERSNDQTAQAFRDAGIVTMYPSQRGGNDNPGKREGFFGEVDDILAAADYAAGLPYVDPERIYLGSHSTGGTLAMLVGECSDRFRAVFALGPVASPSQYGGSFVYHDPENERETDLRSPYLWLDSVRSPMYVIEGVDGNWEGACQLMAENNSNPNVRILGVPGHNHFTVIAPLTELIAQQIRSGEIDLTAETLNGLQ